MRPQREGQSWKTGLASKGTPRGGPDERGENEALVPQEGKRGRGRVGSSQKDKRRERMRERKSVSHLHQGKGEQWGKGRTLMTGQ